MEPFSLGIIWAANQNFPCISQSKNAITPADSKANAALVLEGWDLFLVSETFAKEFLLEALLLGSV